MAYRGHKYGWLPLICGVVFFCFLLPFFKNNIYRYNLSIRNFSNCSYHYIKAAVWLIISSTEVGKERSYTLLYFYNKTNKTIQETPFFLEQKDSECFPVSIDICPAFLWTSFTKQPAEELVETAMKAWRGVAFEPANDVFFFVCLFVSIVTFKR